MIMLYAVLFRKAFLYRDFIFKSFCFIVGGGNDFFWRLGELRQRFYPELP